MCFCTEQTYGRHLRSKEGKLKLETLKERQTRLRYKVRVDEGSNVKQTKLEVPGQKEDQE